MGLEEKTVLLIHSYPHTKVRIDDQLNEIARVYDKRLILERIRK